MTAEGTKLIKLRITSEENDAVMDVPYDTFKQMSTLNDMMSDLYDLENLAPDTVFDIPTGNVTPEMMELILEYCQKFSTCENYTEDELMDWEIEFFGRIGKDSFLSLSQLLPAVNYLNIGHMLSKGCKYVAREIIKNRSVEELRDYFGVENDFTPEEEAKLKEDFAWCIDATKPSDGKEEAE